MSTEQQKLSAKKYYEKKKNDPEFKAKNKARAKRWAEKNKDKAKAWRQKYQKENAEAINRRKKEERVYKWEARTITHLKSKAKKSGIPFNIDVSDIIMPEFCPVLGIKLEVSAGYHKAGSPSVDRIIPELGYVKGNVVVISWRANHLKNNASIEELQNIFQFYYGLKAGTL